MTAIEAVERVASAAGLAFVAAPSRVAKVRAARTLQQVAADRRGVADLPRRAAEQRLGHGRKPARNRVVVCDVRVARERADAHDVAAHLDRGERQPRDVDHARGPFDVGLHQVDERRAARVEARRTGRGERAGIPARRRGDELERAHHAAPRAAATAATMFGYAPQRQMLPLIASRISSSVRACPSARTPTAERICPGVQ